MRNTARAVRAPDTELGPQRRLHLTLVSDEAWRELRELALCQAAEREHERYRRKVRLIGIGVSVGITLMVGFYFAGWLFGSSALGTLVAMVVVGAAILILGVLYFATREGDITVRGKRIG